MDVRRSVNTKIWSDPFFEELDKEEKLLFLYLLTNEKTNMLGIYELSMKRTISETGLSFEEIRKAFEGFERVRKAFKFDNFVFLPNWIKNQAMNKNMLKSASDAFNCLSEDIIISLKLNGFEGFESLRNPSLILPKKEREKEREKEDEIEIEKEDEREKGKSLTFENFLIESKILNSDVIEFLNSESWFEGKAMQLESETEILTEKAKEFLISIRDRDQIEGKELNDLRAHFVSWFKKNREFEKPKSKPDYLAPQFSQL